MSSRLVVVDVVVRKANHPVPGLQQSDFALYEDGAQQTIRYFAPHFGGEAPVANAAATQPPSLPPDTFTNLPVANSSDSVTLLLLDAANTEPADVLYVRREMISYLKKMPPGRRIAVFALGHQLRLLQGFTTDTSQLLVALENAKATSPASLLLDEKEKSMEAEMSTHKSTSDADAAAAWFNAEANARETGMRVDITLKAMQQIARYLSGVPGRKNLVWFSGSFPLQYFAVDPDPVGNSDIMPFATFDEQMKQTADMLVAARIAVYPVDARGVQLPPGGSAESTGPTLGNVLATQDPSIQRKAEQTTMDALAQQTGGRAVYESNGLQEAMANAIDDGSNYYTLAYVPTNTNYNGAQRNIQVRLPHEKANLYYRRSYYADATQDGGAKDGRAIFLESMQRGVPAASQVVFDVRVASLDPNPPSGSVAGANTALKNPAARYAIDYAAVLDTIGLTQNSSGAWQGHVAALAIAYDRDGNRLNWAVNDLPLNLDQASKDAASRNGLQIHQVLDLPAGDVFLRVGLYDPTSGRFGTVEIPLHVAAPK